MGLEIEEKQDPGLTPLGINQAIETGIYLKEYLFKNKYDIILIESSPYLRCLQTAKEVANILDVKSIKMNYLAGEWMK